MMRLKARPVSRGPLVTRTKLEQCGIGGPFLSANIKDIPDSAARALREVLQGPRPWNLFFRSTRVDLRFKFLALCVRFSLGRGLSVRVLNAEEITKLQLDSDKSLLASEMTRDVLCVDANSVRDPSSYEEEAMRYVIGTRARKGKTTIVTSPLTVDAGSPSIRTFYKREVSDLLLSTFRVIDE